MIVRGLNVPAALHHAAATAEGIIGKEHMFYYIKCLTNLVVSIVGVTTRLGGGGLEG